MQSTIWKVGGCVFVGLLTAMALAQPPALPPDPSPSTAPFVPHTATLPPGLHQISAGGVTLYCQPEDDAWVKTAAGAASPTAMPSTMPADLLASMHKHRDELVKMIVADMALPDDKAVNEAIDKKLMPNLEAFAKLKPAIIYMPITHDKLTAIVKGGWTDPRYHYNKILDGAIYDSRIALSADFKLDDLVMWVEVDPAEDAPTRNSKLTKAINFFNTNYYMEISSRAQELGVRNTLVQILLDTAIDPLKLPPKLEWFGRGVASIYAVKYAALITGQSRPALAELATTDEPGFPLRSQPLDLTQIKSREEVRPEPEFWDIYQHACFKKGAAVVNAWVNGGGDGVVAKVMPKLRAAPPGDAAALCRMILESTGKDISLLLPPNNKVVVEPVGR